MLRVRTRSKHTRAASLVLCGVLFASAGHAQMGIRPVIPAGTRSMLEGVGVDEHLLGQVPLDTRFTDHNGRSVTLAEIVDGSRPVVLSLVYHQCANVCSMVLSGLTESLAQQAWTIGQEFDVVTLSIDPRDTADDARTARTRAVGRYHRLIGQNAWHFLVGASSASNDAARVAQAVGFKYRWDEATQQFSHPGVIMLLTRAGKVARYLYGLSYPVQDIRLGLLEASEGRSISTLERVLVYCYRYDQHESKYVVVAWRVMQTGGVLYAAILALGLGWFWRRELRKKPRAQDPLSTNLDSNTADMTRKGSPEQG